MTNRPDALDLCRRVFPDHQASVLKEIDSGRSSARVLVLDLVAPSNPVDPAKAFNGQFILKVQPNSTWPGEQPESSRHEAAVSWSASFAAAHIPQLRFSVNLDEQSVLLYDIAGYSLSAFIGADAVDVGSLIHYCGLLSHGLLQDWNSAYSVNNASSARETLEKWLGYRLNPAEAGDLHSFIGRQTSEQAVFVIGGRLLVNPLRLALGTQVNVPAATVSFNGFVHADLHPGNVLVDRTRRYRENFWLIDFALSKFAPIGFDQAYFELALLLGHLDGADPQRMLTLLEALEANVDTPEARRVPSPDLGIADCARALRQAANAWQQTHERTRWDSVQAQFLLARVAAGLNWTNKPLAEAGRRLALAYAAKAATLLLEQLAPDVLEGLLGAAGAPATRPAFVTPEWPEVWDQLVGFDSSRARYVLVTGRVSVTDEAKSLGLVPWSAIIDLDPYSNETGLHSCIGRTLGRLRSVNQFGRQAIPVDADRGTAWLMVNGWPSRFEPQPANLRKWRNEYGDRLRDTCDELRRAAAPLPVKVIVLATAELESGYFRSAVAMVDEALDDLSDITVIGRVDLSDDPGVKASYGIDVEDFTAALHQILGGDVQVDEPTVPSASGSTRVPLDQLRNLNEDLEVLHSRILNESDVDTPADSFWRGNPPNWIDLHGDSDVRREVGPRIRARVSELLDARGNYTVEVQHGPGAGGTTAALRCAWDLRNGFPVCILRRYSRTTADRVDQLFRLAQKPVLLVAEAATLPVPQREDLHREIARRNVRCVILYVVRVIGERARGDGEHYTISDPMSDGEAEAFRKAFALRTSSSRRQQLLRELATSESLSPYRTPFLFGLVTYEEEFERLDDFVSSFRQDLPPAIASVIRFIALVTRFSQTGLSTALVKKLLGLEADSQIDLLDALGEAGSKLAIERGQSVRLLHPLVGEEFLRQELGGAEQWTHGLRDLSLEFIAQVSSRLEADSDESLRLYASLFIKRDFWTPKMGLRKNFSDLILTIPSSAGQHVVLQRLTEICPFEPHFWNHLGRHHIYEMKQDFAAAESYLKKAVELDVEEHVHHHALGMVRRFWIRSLIAEQLRMPKPPSAEELLANVSSHFDNAAVEFALVRKLAPEEDHGYITHIQLIIEVLEGLVRVSVGQNISALSVRLDGLGNWVRRAIVVAEDLLGHVKQARQRAVPSKYELNCGNRLATLYGHFDVLVSSLEALVQQHDDADVRRALATAYYSRSGRSFSHMSETELRYTKELMEDNLRSDPTNERDIRAWFQAFRRVPEFSYIDAIDRLESWAKISNAVDAFYYLYILHFLRWQSGAERDESAMQVSLEECRKRSIGRRGLSYEWLGKGPEWCPIVHASELGERRRDQEFFENTEPLKRIRGTIDSFKGPQAGAIRLGQQALAFFLPGTKFSESRHLNAAVDFYLGFAYDGLRAWLPEFLEERATLGEALAGAASEPQVTPSARSTARPEEEGKSVLMSMAQRWVRDEVVNAGNRGEALNLAELGKGLKKQFGTPPLFERLGFERLESLLRSWPFLDVTKRDTTTWVSLKSESGTPAKETHFIQAGETHDPPPSKPLTELRRDVQGVILEALGNAERSGKTLYLATLGNTLIERVGVPVVYRRLGFARLRDLIESLEGVTVDPDGLVVRRSRDSES